MKTEEIIRDFREIKQDYLSNDDIMSTEAERVSEVKRIINERLSVVDKTIILLYIDCLSYRKLGKRLGLSHMTCRKEVLRIKEIIMKEYASIKRLSEDDIRKAAVTNAERYLPRHKSAVASAFEEGVKWYQSRLREESR